VRQLELLPQTFGSAELGHPDDALLVNSGCWVARLDREWVPRFPGFEVRDRVVKDAGGRYVAQVEPEDWRASRWWHKNGVVVRATTRVKLLHHGDATFANAGGWGECDADPQGAVVVPDRLRG